jgi:hypothetical protein
LSVAGRTNVRQVAALHVEPLHLLVKQELLEEVTARLTALEGKTVNVGVAGSGTHSLAVEVLAFAGLRARDSEHPKGYVPTAWSRQQLFAEKERARLPDAVLLVSSLPSETAKYLVTRHGYRLVPLPFGEAFALEAVGTAAGEPQPAPDSGVDKKRISATSVPAFTYSVEPPIPPAPLPSLGSRLLLVAHKDVDPQTIRQLVEVTLVTEFAKINRPPLVAKFTEVPPEFPWHAGTQLYRERNSPVVSGALMDSAQKGFAILAAAASGLFVLWQWTKQYSQFTRDKGFNKYLSQVTRIEEQALQAERDGAVSLPQLHTLREQLDRLKTEALDRFTEGELAGKDLLAGFLALVSEVRNHVTRLIQQHDHQVQRRTGGNGEPLTRPEERPTG